MDLTILYILCFLVLTIGLAVLVKYLQKTQQVTPETLQLVASALGLSIAMVSELNLQQENKIVNIGNVIIDSLKYAQEVLVVSDKIELESNALAYAYRLCTTQGIELTESRVEIIDSLIKLSISNMQ